MTTKKNNRKENSEQHPPVAQADAREACVGEQAVGRCRSLTAEQEEYIRLAVANAQRDGTIRKTPGALRADLKRRAQKGGLDISDLQALREEEQHRQEAEYERTRNEHLVQMAEEDMKRKRTA